jgi:hypothetical protein
VLHFVCRNGKLEAGFCLSFDIIAGGFLAILLMRRSAFAVTT